MKGGVIFCASDKSLYDALNQKTVTNENLRELFLTRAILVSRESSRKALAFHFSRLTHDYADYERLAKIFGSPSGRDKMSSSRVKGESDLAVFESSAQELKANLEKEGATVKIYTAKGDRLDIEIKYQKLHFNKSDFRQVVNKTATITIRRSIDGVIVHTPHSDDAREWIHEIVKVASEKIEKKLEVDEIELPAILTPEQKTAFFTELIKNVGGYKLHDVTDVYVSKPKKKRVDDDDDDDDGDLGIHIDKASLKGQGVLGSPELDLLKGRGFYVSRIIWTAKQDAVDSDLYEFEAQFSSPEECKDFTYLPRGFYKRLESGEIAHTRTGLSRDEEHKFGQLIEVAARDTLTKTIGVP